MTITPDMAKYILETHNLHNRPKKPAKISEYATDMHSGSWGLTGDTIKFSDLRLLRDGQNRLLACLKSGDPFTTHIVFGIEDKLFHKMDIGKVRTGSDCLAIVGVKNSTLIAASIRWCLLLENDRVKTRDVYTNESILRAWETIYSKPIDGVFLANSAKWGAASNKAGLCGSAIATALHFMFSRKNQKKADAFFEGFAKALNISKESDPRNRIRQKIAMAKDSSGTRLSEVSYAAWIILAWNAFQAGRSITASGPKWEVSEMFPVIHG
ncbi:hypothetical protein CU669_15175 [Paramagnetospirillum kuznetsovii]|uniref:Uncharacterized protein n=2 Tax=Paramagnetospirillum kuznetsovii TaxID=2053833 RepID=A0A364NVI4_9PROT|nr:hypothetical protein CU669_15175 [Paramagnetospirillum kuznetsovii]